MPNQRLPLNPPLRNDARSVGGSLWSGNPNPRSAAVASSRGTTLVQPVVE